MYHFDEALQAFLKKIRSILKDKIQEIIVLRDVYGRISCHVSTNNNAEILSRFEESLEADKNLKLYYASSPVIAHESDDPIWKRMQKLGQPLDDTSNIRVIERILEGRSWFQATSPPFISPPPYIITFYSFKGGVGRTTAAALVARQLALQGNGERICLIDFDFEAPGLSNLALDKSLIQSPSVGVIDYLLERRLVPEKSLPMEDYLVRITDPEIEKSGGDLWLMPAGIIEEHYLNKLGRLDLQAMLMPDTAALGKNEFPQFTSALNHLFQDLQSHFAFDYYIVDSRTGITDIGGLALNGLSHLNVMLFGLGEQNTRGMEFVLEHLRPHFEAQALTPEQIAGRLLIAFSPIPWGRGRLKDEELENELREVTYGVVMEQIYKPLWPTSLSFPDVGDDEIPNEPVPHHPVIIPYLEDLPLQETLEDMDYVQSQHFSAPYNQLTRRIYEVKLPLLGKPTSSEKIIISDDVLNSTRQELSSLQITGAAEDDLNSEAALREQFLPLPHFRFLFDPKAFLILGRKGSGKSALFQVLRFPDYVNDLADYLELPTPQKRAVRNARWIIGFSRETQTYNSLGSDNLSELDRQAQSKGLNEFYIRFWKYLAVWSVQKKLGPAGEGFILLPDIPRISVEQLYNAEVISGIERFLDSLEEKVDINYPNVYPNISQIYLVYDYLDRMLPSRALPARARYLSGLVEWWQSRVLQGKRLLSKIFLREDIFDNEVKANLEDAAKITPGVLRYTIRWSDNDNLYRLFLKRAFGALKEHLEQRFPNLYWEFDQTQVGIIPPGQEEAIRPIIEWLVGEYMGATEKKGYVYTWIPKHLSDNKGQVAPRWIIALFANAAKLANEQELKAPIIPQKTIRKALQSIVSNIAVDDLRTEYKGKFQTKNGSFLPDLFQEKFNTFPQSEKDLLDFIKSRISEEDNAKTMLAGLEEIGLLERRDPTKRRPEEHYQIPDIFLYGLGLTRRG